MSDKPLEKIQGSHSPEISEEEKALRRKKYLKFFLDPKYSEERAFSLVNYFDQEYFYEINGKKYPNPLPTIEYWCFQEGINRDTYYKWRKEHDLFRHATKIAEQLQQHQLISLALLGFYKEGFAKFLATNVTNLREKRALLEQEIEESKKTLTLNYNLEDKKQ